MARHAKRPYDYNSRPKAKKEYATLKLVGKQKGRNVTARQSFFLKRQVYFDTFPLIIYIINYHVNHSHHMYYCILWHPRLTSRGFHQARNQYCLFWIVLNDLLFVIVILCIVVGDIAM